MIDRLREELLIEVLNADIDTKAAEIERLKAIPRDIQVADSMIRELRVEIEQLRAAAMPFAELVWMVADLQDDNCKLTLHSGRITVGHWRALRAALDLKP